MLAAVGCVSPATSDISEPLSANACPDNVPAAIVPASDQDLALALAASGVQKYVCKATATGYAWTFVAPEASLYTHADLEELVGHHYASTGPTWEYEDGSLVVGARRAGATVDPTAIPWLLLAVVSSSGEGRLSPITSIQRLQTTGGNARPDGCDAEHVGATDDVPYTARYFFYRTASGNHAVRCGS